MIEYENMMLMSCIWTSSCAAPVDSTTMTTVSNSNYEKKSSRTTAAAALTQGTGLTHIISLSPRQFVTIDQTTMKAINKIINSIICCIFASKMSSYIFILCIWQTLLSKVTYIAVLHSYQFLLSLGIKLMTLAMQAPTLYYLI